MEIGFGTITVGALAEIVVRNGAEKKLSRRIETWLYTRNLTRLAPLIGSDNFLTKFEKPNSKNAGSAEGSLKGSVQIFHCG